MTLCLSLSCALSLECTQEQGHGQDLWDPSQASWGWTNPQARNGLALGEEVADKDEALCCRSGKAGRASGQWDLWPAFLKFSKQLGMTLRTSTVDHVTKCVRLRGK